MKFDPRDNWRIILLVVLLVASAVALFVPGIGLGTSDAPGDQATSSPTNLQFGLDLQGGSRIRAPLVGMTAEEVDPGDRNASAVERSVYDGFDNATRGNLSRGDILLRLRGSQNGDSALEVRADINRSTFTSALDAAGVDYGSVRSGVTEQTRQETVRVIRTKIDETGLADRTVQSVFSAGDGRHYVLVEVPGKNVSSVRDLISTRGTVQVDAYHQNEAGNWTNRTVLRQDNVRRIGIAQRSDNLGPHVPLSVRNNYATEFQSAMVDTGVAQRGDTVCGWPGDPEFETRAGGTRGPCLLTVVDGEVVYSAGMDRDLGSSMVDGTWDTDPQFVLQTNNLSEARDLSINLRAGELPTKLDVPAGTTSFVAPSLAENFKLLSLITGLVAVFAVAVEDDGPVAALRRSWELASGNRWRLLALVVLLGVVGGVSGAVGSVFSLADPLVGQVVSIGITSVFLVLMYGILADAFLQLREEPLLAGSGGSSGTAARETL